MLFRSRRRTDTDGHGRTKCHLGRVASTRLHFVLNASLGLSLLPIPVSRVLMSSTGTLLPSGYTPAAGKPSASPAFAPGPGRVLTLAHRFARCRRLGPLRRLPQPHRTPRALYTPPEMFRGPDHLSQWSSAKGSAVPSRARPPRSLSRRSAEIGRASCRERVS